MSDILTRAPPPRGQIVHYGDDPLQFAELRYPPGGGKFPLLFVIHGGFWSAAYDLTHIGHLSAKFTSYGVVTCTIEYRRFGNPGGGWPGTLLDVATAVDYFRGSLASDPRVDLERAVTIGHSAGGHLSLWLGGRQGIPDGSVLHTGQKNWLTAVVSLAGVADLAEGWNENLGNGAVRRIVGGSPNQYPDRYRAASPIELLPMGVRQVLIHGVDDDTVPVSQSEKFVSKARDAGDQPSLVTLEGVGHFELIDPESRAWNAVAGSTLQALGVR